MICSVLAMLAAMTAHWAHGADTLTLTTEGTSAYVIVLPNQAAPSEQTAADQLQDYLQQVTGAMLPIRCEGDVDEAAPQIVVGVSDRTKRLLPDVRLADLGSDGICMKTIGANLVLAGPEPRGTLYAVYTFLEDVVGCRWWTSTESTIPKRPTLEIPEMDALYAPAIISRETFYRDAFNCPWAVQLKLNGHFMQIPRKFGGHIEINGWCHTFFRIIPPSTYSADHPNWYSEINGVRTAERTQLCLTDETMRDEYVRLALASLRAEEDPRIISVSQNDWYGQCQCAKCKKLEDDEGSPSGPLIHFVNAVAEEIEKEFPEVLVETLAYQYASSPEFVG